jgi:hypothetical protein
MLIDDYCYESIEVDEIMIKLKIINLWNRRGVCSKYEPLEC